MRARVFIFFFSTMAEKKADFRAPRFNGPVFGGKVLSSVFSSTETEGTWSREKRKWAEIQWNFLKKWAQKGQLPNEAFEEADLGWAHPKLTFSSVGIGRASCLRCDAWKCLGKDLQCLSVVLGVPGKVNFSVMWVCFYLNLLF